MVSIHRVVLLFVVVQTLVEFKLTSAALRKKKNCPDSKAFPKIVNDLYQIPGVESTNGDDSDILLQQPTNPIGKSIDTPPLLENENSRHPRPQVTVENISETSSEESEVTDRQSVSPDEQISSQDHSLDDSMNDTKTTSNEETVDEESDDSEDIKVVFTQSPIHIPPIANNMERCHIRCENEIQRRKCCSDSEYCQPLALSRAQCIAIPKQCNAIDVGIEISGDNISVLQIDYPEECSEKCFQTKGCKAFTFIPFDSNGPSMCYLKSSTGERLDNKRAVSCLMGSS